MAESLIQTEERCPQCEYSLEGLPDNHRCPECGFAYQSKSFRVFRQRGYFWLYAGGAVFMLCFVGAYCLILGRVAIHMLVYSAVFAVVSIGQIVYEKCRKPNRIALSEDRIVFFRRNHEPLQFAWHEIESIQRNIILGMISIRAHDMRILGSITPKFLGSTGRTSRAIAAAREQLGLYRGAHREENT